MQIVIDIPNEDYESIKDRYDIDNVMVQSNLIASIMNGRPLPKGHGRLIDGDALAEKGHITKDYLTTFADTIIEADKE